MGYSLISGKEVRAADVTVNKDALKKIIKKHYPNKKSPGIGAYQLHAFFNEMKIGDYILIPAWGTNKITVGQISSDPFKEVLKAADKEYSEFNNRRQVKWVSSHSRNDISPKVWRIFNTHQTIVNATEYAEWIDPLIFDLFKKNGVYHFLLKIRRENDINARILFMACLELFELVDDFAKKNDFNENADGIDTKINLNSPGKIEFAARAAKVIAVLSITVLLINGGGIDAKIPKLGIDFDMHTDGIIKQVSDFLNDRSNRNLKASLVAKIANLKIEDSAQVSELIRSIDAGEKVVGPDKPTEKLMPPGK
jgi:hypothetical protein